MNIHYLFLASILITVNVSADSSTLDAAIGGGIGGAVGAAIGNEIGGRDGAIVGGALGGGIGAAVNTDDEPNYKIRKKETYYRDERHRPKRSGSGFCPPGQAKKGRC